MQWNQKGHFLVQFARHHQVPLFYSVALGYKGSRLLEMMTSYTLHAPLSEAFSPLEAMLQHGFVILPCAWALTDIAFAVRQLKGLIRKQIVGVILGQLLIRTWQDMIRRFSTGIPQVVNEMAHLVHFQP